MYRATAIRAGAAVTILVCLTVAVAAHARGSGTARADAAAAVDPSDFVRHITNPYLPWKPGSVWVYRGTKDGVTQRDVVKVLYRTKSILGITATVVTDVATHNGRVLERTSDWYAQDRAGNVWYFGEDTKEYEHGKVVSTKGSWEAGVDGARPGIVMEADPRPGDSYRQEYDPGNAEDAARVLRTGATARVRNHTYRDALVTRDTTRLEPQLVEHKYFVAGIGLVLEDTVRGGPERVELVSHTPA